MFINRSWNRTEKDDFTLSVEHLLNENNEAFPVYCEGKLVGWKIQNRFE